MSEPTTTPADRAGEFDTLLTEDGTEVDVLILEDGPARMIVKVIENGQVFALAKAVQ